MKNRATVLSLGSLFAALFLVLIVVVPAFAGAPTVLDQTLTIAENSASGTLTSPSKIVAFDPEGDHLSNKLTYDSQSGATGYGIFEVGSSTGIVSLAPGQSLDYESVRSYTLNVKIQDMENFTDTAIITINVTDVSDEDPELNDQTFNVAENSPNNTLVGKLLFTDADVNDSHTFTIESGNGAGTGAFLIESDGEIRVKDSAQLDYEDVANRTYNLGVKITDLGGQTGEATVTINVTNVNEKPVISNQSFSGLSEAASNETAVGTIVATDPDAGDMLSFMRTSGSAAFAVNGSTGQVTVADSTLLDYETQPSPSFVVMVSDGKGGSSTATITVNLVNVNDTPRVTGGGIPDVINNQGTLSATRKLWDYFQDDEDADNKLNFIIQSNLNPGGFFSSPPMIDNSTGVLTMNFVANAAGEATLTIRATDMDGAFVDDTFKVFINKTPVAQGYSDVTVNEDAPNYSINLYGGFTDTEELSSALVYSIPAGGVSNQGLFSSVTINLPNLVLDFAPDANGLSTITIRATDSAGLWAETTFNVKVNPVNDQPTTSGIGNVTVAEDAPNTVIKLYESFNDKEDDPKQLIYAVTTNTNPGLFDAVTIDAAQATLTLAYKPNVSGTADLTVTATDKGISGTPGSALSVSTTFNVTVTGDNDLPVLQDIAKTIDEDAPYKFLATDFTSKFTDADGDPLVNVKIVTLPAQGTLKLDGVAVTANQIITAADLDKLVFTPALNWDEGSTSFQWNASDGTAFAAAPALVTFTVTAKNDAPIITDVLKTGQEGVNVLFALADFTTNFTDVDGDTLNKIRIDKLPAHGALRLGNANVTANQQIDAASISNLRYVPDPFYFGEDRFEWSASDGTDYSNKAAVILTLAPTNDAPTLDLNGDGQGTGFSATFVAGGPPVQIVGPNVTITDIDDTMMEGATIIIINAQHGTKEILDAVVSDTNITKQYNAGSGVLILTGSDTIENYEKVLKTITFKIESDVTNINTTVVRNVSVRVYDGDLNSNDTTSKVTVINPRIDVVVTPPIQTIPRGNPGVFYVEIQNTGSVTLQNITATSVAVPDCNHSVGTLAPGEKFPIYACIASNVQGRIDNEIKVTALEPQTGTQREDKDKVAVRVLQPIGINVSPAPSVGDVLVQGQNAVFDVTVINPSDTSELKEVSVKAFIDYDITAAGTATPAELVPAPECDKVIGTLAPLKEMIYTCTIPNVQRSFKIEVRISAKIDGITPTENFDIGEISVLNMSLDVFAVPFEVIAGEPTSVEYSMTLTNISNVPLTLSALSSNLHGNLLDTANGNITANSCAGLNLSIPAGGAQACSYKVMVSLPSGALTNAITLTATGGDNKQFSVTDQALISVGDFEALAIMVSASPTSVVAPGGPVNLTVQVANNTSSELTLDSLVDSLAGNLDGKGSCDTPRAIQAKSSYSCTYTVTISGKKPGDVVTHTVTAVAGDRNPEKSVEIRVTSTNPTGQARLLLPSVSRTAVAGEPNNSYSSPIPIATNQNYYFYADDANDWYSFIAGPSGSARIKLSNFQVSEGQLLVYVPSKYDKPIGHNGAKGLVPTREIMLTGLTAGNTYYIWVLSVEGLNSASPYTLRVETTGP